MKPDESDKPVPRKGDIMLGPLPEGGRGIQFEIARISKYIAEGRQDGAVIAMAHKLSELASDTARQVGSTEASDLICSK